MPYFAYDDKAVSHLTRRDKKLGAAIAEIGPLHREVTPDLFEALVSSVIAQQISSKAAATVAARLAEKAAPPTPASLEAMSQETIQQCGMSLRKALYIKGIAHSVCQGELNLAELAEMPDQEVVKCLSALNGIGVWTAEMLLIFALQRPDVLSWGDLGIKRGMMRLYHKKDISREFFERLRKRYSPYGSVASLYLWALA